jgi:uncharacterized protein with FMN-binding domain
MRRISLWILSTVSALVLLFSYRTSTSGPAGVTTDTVADGTTNTNGSSGTGSSSTGSSSTGSSGAGSYDGTVAQTRWGPVQVRIIVQNGRITDVQALQVPAGNARDREINNRAVPVLRREALAAQSADIDTVSGATVTSEGYRQSLQAAIDNAHLG